MAPKATEEGERGKREKMVEAHWLSGSRLSPDGAESAGVGREAEEGGWGGS